MKSFFPAFLLLLLSQAMLAQDTIRFQLCSELWKDARPIKGTTLTFQPINPSFPYSPMVFALDSSQHCADVTVVLSEYLPGTTFIYSASLPDTGYLNGVSVVDLCKIAQHITGINPLPSPYALLAADANQSGSITTFDIVELRKLIYGIYSSLPTNTAWKFIADYCNFPNPGNPFQGACQSGISSTELAALDGGISRVLGIKIGDVDGDARLNGEPYVPPIVSDSLTMLLTQGQVSTGVPVAIPIKFDKNFTLGSLQAKFFLDPALMRYDSISGGLINVVSPNVAHYDTLTGQLKFATGGYFDLLVTAGVPLFYIHFTPLQVADVSDVLKLAQGDPNYRNFAIGDDCALYYTIGASYSGSLLSHSPHWQGLRVHPPSPNPFDEHTFLEIELESNETALLEVLDLTGRIVYSAEKNLSAGNYRWEIPAYAVAPGSLAVWRLQVGERMVAGKLVRK